LPESSGTLIIARATEQIVMAQFFLQ